jgi:transposase InsO family protein
VSKLVARYRAEGEAAFEPRSRRPKSSPTAISAQVVEAIVRVRKELTEQGLDAGPHTIAWHLAHHHHTRVAPATISRYLTAHGLVTSEPKKRPKSSYIRFEASMPNECWQADFTHYRLANPDGNPGVDVEILSWIDDCSRYALSVTAHRRVTGPIVAAEFRNTVAIHGIPASTLTDNGLVFTTRFSGGRGGRNALEHELRKLGVIQKNSRPNHPTTCGKVERFQQTLKNWLAAQPDQPTTLAHLQVLLDRFRDAYNQHRPHRSLPHQRQSPEGVETWICGLLDPRLPLAAPGRRPQPGTRRAGAHPTGWALRPARTTPSWECASRVVLMRLPGVLRAGRRRPPRGGVRRRPVNASPARSGAGRGCTPRSRRQAVDVPGPWW